MTIKDLKEFIKDLPDDMLVMTADSEWGTEESSWKIAEDHYIHDHSKIPYIRTGPFKYLRIS